METTLTACVDTKVDNVIKATREKVEKSYAEIMAVQPKEASNVHTGKSTKTMSDMDLNVRRIVRFQGIPTDPEKSKAETLVPDRRGERNAWRNGRDDPHNRKTTTHEIRLWQTEALNVNANPVIRA